MLKEVVDCRVNRFFDLENLGREFNPIVRIKTHFVDVND